MERIAEWHRPRYHRSGRTPARHSPWYRAVGRGRARRLHSAHAEPDHGPPDPGHRVGPERRVIAAGHAWAGDLYPSSALRIEAQPVPDADDALGVLHAPDQVQRGPPQFDNAFDGDHSGPNGHPEVRRVETEFGTDDDLRDLVPDVLIRPFEDRKHIGPGHDADQLAVVVDDWQPLDQPVLHEPGCVHARQSGRAHTAGEVISWPAVTALDLYSSSSRHRNRSSAGGRSGSVCL